MSSFTLDEPVLHSVFRTNLTSRASKSGGSVTLKLLMCFSDLYTIKSEEMFREKSSRKRVVKELTALYNGNGNKNISILS